MRDFEDLSAYGLDPEREAELLRTQTECTFIWSTRDGFPVGVVMSFIFHEGSFWLTSATHRARVRAVRRDPRVSIVVSSTGSALPPGSAVTYKGTCRVHEDDARKQWFYNELAMARYADDEEYRRVFLERIDSPGRVILEVVPEARIAHDGTKMHGAGRAGNPYAERLHRGT